ncbi:MAG: PadR family transcriptional regulator [Halolamina sp.]
MKQENRSPQDARVSQESRSSQGTGVSQDNRPSQESDSSCPACTVATHEPQPLSQLTGFKRSLLFELSKLWGEQPCGQDLKERMNSEFDSEIKHGRLYQNLSELVDEGYVKKLPLDGRTNVYRLTDEGYHQLQAHHKWQNQCLSNRDGEPGNIH